MKNQSVRWGVCLAVLVAAGGSRAGDFDFPKDYRYVVDGKSAQWIGWYTAAGAKGTFAALRAEDSYAPGEIAISSYNWQPNPLVAGYDYDYVAGQTSARWAGWYAGAGLSGNFAAVGIQDAGGQSPEMEGSGAPGEIVTLGRNWQSGPWVVGIEGNHTNSTIRLNGAGTKLKHAWISASDYGAFQLRGGYAAGWLLFYATTGLELNEREVFWNHGRSRGYGVNFVSGAGVEYKIDPHWNLRTEAKFFSAIPNNFELPGGDATVNERTSVFRFGIGSKF